MKPTVIVTETAALPRTGAEHVAAAIRGAIGSRGTCRLALSGGSTPRPVYEALATFDLDWSKVRVFWGDERCVPKDHPASNYRMAKEALLDRVAIPESQVARISGELPPEQAAAAYSEALGALPLDVALLGLGDDCHTASIFPSTVEAPGQRVMATTSPLPPSQRISLTTTALSEARQVVFLISGAGKAGPVAQVMGQLDAPNPSLPAARVRPANGTLTWILDAAAAAQLG